MAISLTLYNSSLMAEESLKPPHSVNSLQIAKATLSKIFINSHYKVIGSCTWTTKKFPPKVVVAPSVEQFLPDLIVTVANRPSTNPWYEAKLLFENSASQKLYKKVYREATGSDLGFGEAAGQITEQHINDERTRVVNVIGTPSRFFRFPYLSHRAETSFGKPYYLSEADAVSDRLELAEVPYMLSHPHLLFNHDIGGNGQIWGHEVPRLMRVTQPSRFRASVVAALHAADIVTNNNSLHVTKSTSNSCGHNCVVSNVIFDPKQEQVIWQEVYPNNHNIDFNESIEEGMKDDEAGNGNYIFVVWRKYRGCVNIRGHLIRALAFPKVGQPQKR